MQINNPNQFMTRIFLPYNRSILKISIIFSIVLTISSLVLFNGVFKSDNIINSLTYSYIFWLMTGGFLISVFYFELTRKNEYYFYYNLGISKIKLLLSAYLLHLVFIIPILFIQVLCQIFLK